MWYFLSLQPSELLVSKAYVYIHFQDPPHELVYAKLKGYSYWPAKVIHYVTDDKYDVRFFGGLHQRAVIPKDQIKPVDADLKKLNIKKTAGTSHSYGVTFVFQPGFPLLPELCILNTKFVRLAFFFL